MRTGEQTITSSRHLGGALAGGEDRARADDGSPSTPRREAIAAAARLLAAVRAGRGGALFVIGEAGIGKTAALDEIRRMATPTTVVADARGEEMERHLPLGLATQAFAALGEHDLLAPATGSSEAATPHLRVMQWLAARPSSPLLIAIDDLHWADVDSLGLLLFLARRLRSAPIAIVATLRPWPLEAERGAAALVDGGHAEAVRLAPLDPPAVGAMLAAALAAEPDPGLVDQVWRLCRGNPLLVEQVIAVLGRGERLPAADVLARDVGERLLLARFAGLEDRALRCARAGAVLGTTFLPELAAEVAGLGEHELDEVFDALHRSGLVVDDEHGRVRFVHPLLAQALAQDLVPALRRRYHARAFRLLSERRLGDAAAEHAVRAELVGDPAAIAALEERGRRSLAVGAAGTAARQLDAAMRFSGDRPSASLVAAYAEAALNDGRANDAVAVVEDVLPRDDAGWRDAVALREVLGRALFATGRAERASARLDEAVARAIAHDPERAAVPLAVQALARWVTSGPREARDLAARARELLGGAGEAVRLRADAAWGLMTAYTGDPAGFDTCAAVAARLSGDGAEGGPTDLLEVSPQPATAALAGLGAMLAERLDDAGDAFARVSDKARRVGAVESLAVSLLYRSYLEARRGRLDAARGTAEEATELFRLSRRPPAYALLARAEALLWLGRMEECDRHCAEAGDAPEAGWYSQIHVAHVRGLRRLWAGDRSASAQFLRVEELARSVGLEDPCLFHWAEAAVAAHLDADAMADAERVAAWLAERAAAHPGRWPRFAAALAGARIAAVRGDGDAADAGFRAGLAALDGVDLPLQRAGGLLAHGRFLRRRGRRTAARSRLAEALRLAEAAGAAPIAAQAAEELRLAGGRRRRSAEDRDALTPAELRVALAAADGLANAEIATRLHLSVNTVETHLKRIYAKLELRNRRGLMTMGAADLRRRARGAG